MVNNNNQEVEFCNTSWKKKKKRRLKRSWNWWKHWTFITYFTERIRYTYCAESGMPLPLLQNLLGHSSIRTTALYWQNIYRGNGGNNDTADKKWLERQKPSQNKEKGGKK